MRVISLSTVYPTPASPGRGIFVHRRMLAVARHADVKVLAPVSVFDYGARRLGKCAEWHRWSEETLEVLHHPWMYPPGGSAWNALCLAAALWKPMADVRKQFAFDLIDAHFGYPEAIAAALLAHSFHVPFVVTLRGSELLHSEHVLRWGCMAWALRKAARVIAVSEELGRLAIACGVPSHRIAVVPNGVSGNIFHLRCRSEIRNRLGIPGGCKVILTAGHLIRLKRHDRVIRAVSSLRQSGEAVKLVIAGGVGQGVVSVERELRQLIADLDLVPHATLVGQIGQTDLAEWMCAADIFCCVSSREGSPNVVHEALACGTPVIGTRVGAIPDLIKHPDYGTIVEVDDQDGLQLALRNALVKTWNREAISRWALSRSWNDVGAEVFREFSEVLKRVRQSKASESSRA